MSVFDPKWQEEQNERFKQAKENERVLLGKFMDAFSEDGGAAALQERLSGFTDTEFSQISLILQAEKNGHKLEEHESRRIGVDQGYTEVLVDSDGEHLGIGLGALLSKESDRLMVKNRRRAKIRAVAARSSAEKRARIEKNNLGTAKRDRRAARVKAELKTLTYTAVNSVVDKAGEVVAEDLSKPFGGKNLGKKVNRRLSSWTKGLTAQALRDVSERRGSVLRLVNAAYTSQTCACHGALGKRSGDKFYCAVTGECFHADENAAVSVLNRYGDPEITLYTPYREVKKIIQERTTAVDQTADPEHESSPTKEGKP